MPHLGGAHGGEGKGSARHRPFTSQCGSAPFVRSALPMARPMLFLWGAHGARPARLLSAQPMAKRLLAIRGGAGAWPPPLKAPHWLGLWPVRSSFAVRAPCAHQRRGNASHMAKRFQRRAGHGQGLGKDCDHHFPFPRARTKGEAMLRTWQSASKDAPATGKGEKGLRESLHLSPPKAKQSLVKGTREAPPCAKEPQTNSGRARTGPRPIRP